jgi:hypothetical protein
MQSEDRRFGIRRERIEAMAFKFRAVLRDS